MKKTYIYLSTLFFAFAISSCKKGELPNIATATTGSETQIKFFNFGINSPSVNFYGNDVKISAILSATGTESVNGTAYSAVFPAANYSVLSAGNYKITAVVPSTAAANAGTTEATVTSNLEAGKYYSVYTCGFYDATTKTNDAFVINDVLPPTDQNGYVRFVNTIPNATAGYSLYAKNTVTQAETLIGSSVAYKGASTFVALPAPGIYEFYARYASAPTVNLISRNGTSVVTVLAGRAYTISSRGDNTVSTAGTATNRPFLDVSTNR